MKIYLATADQSLKQDLCPKLEKRLASGALEIVEDGAALYEKAVLDQPRLVILDVLLPGLDGLSVLYRIRKLPEARQPSVIVLSRLHSERLLNEVARLQPDFYTTVPCDAELLINHILYCCREQLHMQLQNCTDLERSAGICLHACGLSSRSNGWSYIREGICRLCSDPELCHALTKRLYPDIAKKYHTTASCVERSIRSAVTAAWKRDGILWQDVMFDDRPTNGELMVRVAEYIREKLDDQISL